MARRHAVFAGEVPRPRCRGAYLRNLLATLALLTVPMVAVAQQAPAMASDAPIIAVDAFDHVVGDTFTLRAEHLDPGGAYRVTLTPPEGAEAPSAPLVTLVDADASGALTYRAQLDRAGSWRVTVAGARIDVTLTLPVRSPTESVQDTTPAPPETTEATPTEPTPTEPTPTELTPSESTEPALPATTEPTPSEPTEPTPSEPTEPAPGATPTQPVTPPVRRAPTSATPPSVSISAGDVVAVSAGVEVWRLSFPPASGETVGVVQDGGSVYVGHGNHLLVIDAATGTVATRYRLPAAITALRPPEADAGTTTLEATVRYGSGDVETLSVTPDGPQATTTFDPTEPALYGWLRAEAQVDDPAARLAQDPTNPWLYYEAAVDEPARANTLLAGAQAHAVTFYERAQLARAFLRLPEKRADLAAEAMDGALEDFVARGYRPETLVDQELAEAYGFPLGALRAALARGDLSDATFWGEWVYAISSPAVPATQEGLRELSRDLRAGGRADEASLWRTRADEGGRFDLATSVRRAAVALGNTGWYGVVALLVAILAMHLTLLAKYWRPQTLMLRQRRESGGKPGAVPRLFAMRYATITEKLVIVLLFAAALVLVALHGWVRTGDDLPVAWGSGALTSEPARVALEDLDETRPDAWFVRGYAAQLAGDEASARADYLRLGDDPDALNNLGALDDDTALFERALELEPRHPQASFNLRQGANPSPLLARYAPDAPALVPVDEARLRSAVAGSFQSALGQAFRNPWQAMVGAPGVRMPHWVWLVLVVLFLAWVAISVIWLVVPRPRLARSAPRTFTYHLLALLLPGSGLADELWGVLLLVPWAIFGTDALLHLLPLGAEPTMALRADLIALGVLYVLNLVAFVVEFGSYRRRMQELTRQHPETALAYGMRVPEAPPQP